MHAAEAQHLAAVFGGGDMAHHLALMPHGGGLRGPRWRSVSIFTLTPQ
jgi:hypothetical protein